MTPRDLDESRFPTLAAYVRRLPAGLASHPEATMKASIYREALADKPIARADCEAMPEELADLVLQPRLVSTWVSTALLQGFFLALADVYGMNDQAFAAWSYVLQKRLYRSPLYRALTVLASPTMLLTGARVRWGSIHRGTELEVDAGSNEARIVLLYPPYLFAPRNLLGFAAAFRSVIELSNAAAARVELVSTRPTEATFQARWE